MTFNFPYFHLLCMLWCVKFSQGSRRQWSQPASLASVLCQMISSTWSLVGRQACKLSHDSPLPQSHDIEKQRQPESSYTVQLCLIVFLTCVQMHAWRKCQHFVLSLLFPPPFLPYATANPSWMHTLMLTPPKIPVHGTAGTITDGD